jgi:hypothetical protein
MRSTSLGWARIVGIAPCIHEVSAECGSGSNHRRRLCGLRCPRRRREKPRSRYDLWRQRHGDRRSSRECPPGVCAVTRRRFPVGANPTRQPLQPEAIGAVMEVTKWLKPSISVSRIGDSASVQAVTRVNAEQSSKRTMRRPTRQPFRGRLIRMGEQSEEYAPERVNDYETVAAYI